MSNEAIIQMAVYLLSAAMTGSTIIWRIQQLEKKVEKHNSLVERMVAVEQSAKSAHHRLDTMERGKVSG